jgi:FG-GAP repeat/PEP-CTERM motif
VPFVNFTGAAYVFQRDVLGQWSQLEKLTASVPGRGDYFGVSVSVSGDTAVIGANHDPDRGIDAGAAYFFQRNTSGHWEEIDKVFGSDTGLFDYFGESVSLSGDTALIGGFGNESAYVLQRDLSGQWSEAAKLTAADGGTSDRFGIDVSIDENTAVIGANYKNSQSGAAYIFREDEFGDWVQIDKLVASDPAILDRFGGDVSISGNTVVVGAVGDEAQSGSAYVFQEDGFGNWKQAIKLRASDAADTDLFSKVAIHGDTVFTGAWRADHGSFLDAGAAYVYELIPEPTSILLGLFGIGGMGGFLRRSLHYCR